MGKLSHRQVKSLAQSNPVSKGQSQDLNPGNLGPKLAY